MKSIPVAISRLIIPTAVLLMASACERNQTPAEKVGNKVDDALDRRPGEKVRDAAEDAKDAVKDAAGDTKDAAKDVSNDIKDAAK